MSSFLDIVLVDKFFSLVDCDVAFNVAAGGLLKVCRGLQPIHGLQSNSHTPCICTSLLLRFTLADILVEIDVLFLGHGFSIGLQRYENYVRLAN